MDGVQYVSILAGWGGVLGLWSKYTDQINPGALYTFIIGGTGQKPKFPKQPVKKFVNLKFEASDEQLERGGKLYERYCYQCHGCGVIPELTYSDPSIFSSFQQIVGERNLLGFGMPRFNDRLSEKDIESIKNYILSEAQSKLAEKAE